MARSCNADKRGWKKAAAPVPNDPSADLWDWMRRRRIRPIDVARILDVKSSAISNFMRGRMKSARIKAWFASQGCPGELLDRLQGEGGAGDGDEV